MKNSTKSLRRLLTLGCALAASTAALAFSHIVDKRETGTPLPIKWPAGTIPLRLLLGSSTTLIDGTNYNSSAQAAAQAWNAVLGNAQITTTVATGAPSDDNRVNELAFAATIYGMEFDTNVLAVTVGSSLANDRIKADILFNTTYAWDSYRGTRRQGIIDIRRVAIHELGHLLGLNHPDEAGQTVTAIMNSRVSDLDALATDDTQGGQALYGPPGPPANNAFANATAIALGSSTTATLEGYNTNATKETGEPNHAGDTGGASVWWRWTAPGNGGSLKVDTRGSYFDTTLGIYTGTSVAGLTTVGSNDDIERGKIQASEVTFTATGGTTYHIAVDGFDGDTAGIKLNLAFTPAAATPPSITTQPTNTTVTAGGSAFFTVAASGTDPLAYQWLFNGNAITGATSATYTINNAQSANAGNYAVTVSNAGGSVTSSTVTLTVNAAPTPPPSSGGGGGGGGGGAPSLWFLSALLVLAAARLGLRPRR